MCEWSPTVSSESALLEGRTAALSLMTDACIVKRETGTAMDPTTLVMVPTFATVYSGPCRVQAAALVARTPNAGDAVHVVTASELQLPVSATVILPGDTATLTASVSNPGLPGRVFRVASETPKTHGTKRSFAIEETLA